MFAHPLAVLALLGAAMGLPDKNSYTQDTVGYESSGYETDPLLQEIWSKVTLQMNTYLRDCEAFGNTFADAAIKFDDGNLASDRAGLVKLCKLNENQVVAQQRTIHNIVPFWTMKDNNGTLKPIPNLTEYKVAVHMAQAVTFKAPIPGLQKNATTVNFTDTIITQTFVRVGQELKSVEWLAYHMYQDPSLPTRMTVTDPLLEEIWNVVTLQMDTFFEDCEVFGSTFAETDILYTDDNIASDRAGLVDICRKTEHLYPSHSYTIFNIVPFWTLQYDSGTLKPFPFISTYKVAVHLKQAVISDARIMNFTDTIITQTFVRVDSGLVSMEWSGYYMYEDHVPSPATLLV